MEHIRDRPKVNVWCLLLHDCLIRPFFLCQSDSDTQQLPVYAGKLCLSSYKNYNLPCSSNKTEHLFISISRTNGLAMLIPSLGRLDHRILHPVIFFFLWGYVKDCVYRTLVADINDLEDRIATAVATVDADMD